MAVYKRGEVWWYEFIFAGRRLGGIGEDSIRRPWQSWRSRSGGANSKRDSTDSKTPATNASKSMKELAAAYLEEYRMLIGSLCSPSMR